MENKTHNFSARSYRIFGVDKVHVDASIVCNT